MHIRRAVTVASAEAVRHESHHREELLAFQIPVRIRPAYQIEDGVLRPFRRRDFGDDLLRQDVERRARNRQPVQFVALNGVEQGAFDQLSRDSGTAAPRDATDLVAPDRHVAKRCDRSRRSELAHEIHIPDIDAQFERRSGDKDFNAPLLSRCSASSRRSFDMLPWCDIT
jgi:hypothetical protein